MAKENTDQGSYTLAAVMFVVMFFLMLVATGFTAVYFNLGGIRPRIIDYLNELHGERTQELLEIEQLNGKVADYERQIQELTNKNTEYETLKQKLEQDELIRIADREKEREETAALNARLSTQISDLEELVKVYEKMEAKNAASILLSMNDSALVTRIVKNLKADYQASVLSEMPAENAASIVKAMATIKDEG